MNGVMTAEKRNNAEENAHSPHREAEMAAGEKIFKETRKTIPEAVMNAIYSWMDEFAGEVES